MFNKAMTPNFSMLDPATRKELQDWINTTNRNIEKAISDIEKELKNNDKR